MGSSSSKLKKKLKKGDEEAVLLIFERSKALQRGFDPNTSYGDRYGNDTALHLAARHAMKRTLWKFLNERGGNPNKKNGRNETSLHCVCQLKSGSSSLERAAREECLNMILEWRVGAKATETAERVDLSAQDKSGNTALHYAAQTGFETCVKTLVDIGAPLFTENNLKHTPCELAERAEKFDIASYLESKMVFCDNDESERAISPEPVDITDDNYQGLKPQELQEVKDTLIVETSDMLRVPLFTAEALLRNHEWSREALLEAWITDPVACCKKCGVAPPKSLDDDDTANNDYELDISKIVVQDKEFSPRPCEICFEDIEEASDCMSMICDHSFCKGCWTDYLHIKIKEGDSHNILCPAHECDKLVPVEFMENIVSSTMARRYLQFDIKAFVDSNPHIRWCPHPGCGLAIQHPDRGRSASVTSRTSLQRTTSSSSQSTQPRLTAHCSNGHSFCWGCQLEPHDPATCDHYKMWLEKIAQVKRDEFQSITKNSEAAATSFWMISNSKKCPNCKSPIEKNEGCNHMRCSKCKHDFCWVCLEPWKWHSSMTGGFFRCTRYEVVDKVDERHQSELGEASQKHTALQELNRFVHYYTRYENHKHSLELEKPLLEQAKQKMSQLVGTDSSKLSAARFLEEAISVLIKARHVLQFCFVYSYYLQESGIKRTVFELFQIELEEKTEYLSEIIARPYLRTPRAQIIKIAREVRDKTEELLTAISTGLHPQDLPHSDSRALSYRETAASSSLSAAAGWLSDTDESGDEQPSAHCKAEGCNKLKLRHSEAPDQHHDYCSSACLKADYLARSQRKHKRRPKNQIDLMQALEMSRRQLLQDADSLTTGGSSSDASGEGGTPSSRRRSAVLEANSDPILEHVLRLSESVYAEEQDADLSLALQLSLQTPEEQERMLRDREQSRRQRAQSYSDDTSFLDSSATTPTTSAEISQVASNRPSPSTSRAISSGGATCREEIRARLDELDQAIAQLLESNPVAAATEPTGENVRRTESERRTCRPPLPPTSSNAMPGSSRSVRRTDRGVRRSKSERRC